MAAPSALIASGISSRRSFTSVSGPSISGGDPKRIACHLAGRSVTVTLTGSTHLLGQVFVDRAGEPRVVWNSWSGPIRMARSFVIFPLSTVSMRYALEGLGELETPGSVHPPGRREAICPGEDRGDRVGRGGLALLVLAEVAGDGAGPPRPRRSWAWPSSGRSSSGRGSRTPGRPCPTDVAVVVLQAQT
jgi:hypothetical protein